jgi:succinate dehydrogenase/fumarate reductase-like Fe-S protein
VSTRLGALSYLGYRAILAQPLKRLAYRGSGLERFLENYAGEGLVPTSLEERAAGEAASACIGCGLCETRCDLARAVPGARALGLHAAFRLYGKSGAELALAGAALAECRACHECEALCPTGVPIAGVVRHLLARAVSASSRAAPGAGRAPALQAIAGA